MSSNRWHFSRRKVIATGLMGVAISAAAGRNTLAQLVNKPPIELAPGEYTWHPDRAPSGPLAIIVSLPDQRVYVFRNGIRIATSTCSTGKPGHATPTGVFTILQKDKNHHSSTYDDASMPNMNRLTWSGVALHAGNLPGYPASHGCVRLPLEFSDLLFGVTHLGTPVIIANNFTQPADVVHPGMVLDQYAEHEFEDVSKGMKNKALPSTAHEDNKVPPVSVVISRGDSSATVFESGKVIAEGKAYIKDPSVPLGSHLFTLVQAHGERQGLQWHAVAFSHDAGGDITSADEALIKRVTADPNVIEAMKERMHPGLLLVLTDKPASRETRSDPNFVVIADQPT